MTARYVERAMRHHSLRTLTDSVGDGFDSRQRTSTRHLALPFTVFGRGSNDCTGFERRSLADIAMPTRN